MPSLLAQTENSFYICLKTDDIDVQAKNFILICHYIVTYSLVKIFIGLDY